MYHMSDFLFMCIYRITFYHCISHKFLQPNIIGCNGVQKLISSALCHEHVESHSVLFTFKVKIEIENEINYIRTRSQSLKQKQTISLNYFFTMTAVMREAGAFVCIENKLF